MQSIAIVFCAVLILFCFSQVQAIVIHVPGDSSTIQGGINGAVNGDTVLVAPGTYYEHINFNGKAILVKSEAGAETTTIEKLLDNLSIVTFSSGEDTNAIIDGFTIRNANEASGIECTKASPLIANNIVTGNTTSGFGGGIWCKTSDPVIRNNVISYNTGSGGIFTHQSSPRIVNNEIVSNNSSTTGGGIYCFANSNPTISDNIVASNTCTDGGGILIDSSSNGTVSSNLVSDNTATNRGGGIFCCAYSSPLLLNNTVSNNAGYGAKAGGIVCQFYCSPTIVNNILSGNLAGYGIHCSENSFPSISYDDVWNNASGGYYGCSSGEGCISADPLFRDPENGDFHLMSTACGDMDNSPCIDAGDPAISDVLLDCDSGGLGTQRSDMGAYGGGYLRGDTNGDGIIDVGDVVYLVSYLYRNGPAPSPIDAGDCNCDDIVNVGDVVYLVSYLYRNGPPPGCPKGSVFIPQKPGRASD